VYAYLLKKRCIDREILNAFVRKRLIYESCERSKDGTKEYHNAVFVGFDEHGVPRHGHKRGLYTMGQSYRGNIEGSDPKHSFHYLGGDDTLWRHDRQRHCPGRGTPAGSGGAAAAFPVRGWRMSRSRPHSYAPATPPGKGRCKDWNDDLKAEQENKMERSELCQTFC